MAILMNSVLMMVILCSGLHSINGETLQCEFKDNSYFRTTFYSCSVTALENPNDNKIITGFNGVHQPNKYDTDVEAIYISSLNIEYIPEGLGPLFNLPAFLVQSSQLVEIRSKDFQGMQNLEYLSLYDNKLTSVPSDVFSTIPKLKYIDLEGNQIKYIGSGAFDQLKNLQDVYLMENICVNKVYEGATEITQMKEDIKVNCQNPNDVIQYEIKHKIRDESSRIRKESQEQFKALNEIVKQLLIESKEHQIERQENTKLRAELSTAKEELKMEQEANTKITNKRDQLDKELTEAKKTIEVKLPKMEQTINEFHMEVMDQKIERHYQREDLIALRSKLMEAKEQLAECKNE